MTTKTLLASTNPLGWHDFWRGEFGQWIITRGLRLVMVLIAAVLANPDAHAGKTYNLIGEYQSGPQIVRVDFACR